jgi:hypothetical protein
MVYYYLEFALTMNQPVLLHIYVRATTVWTKKVHERCNFSNSNLGVPLLIKITLVIGFLCLVQIFRRLRSSNFTVTAQ